MASPPSTARKKKRTRRSSAGDVPTLTSVSADNGDSVPAEEVSLSARGKRRRPAAPPDVPWRFSRIGGTARPPPHRRCASAQPAVFSGDTYSTGLFRLTGVGVPVDGINASVSGPRLDNIFSGCGASATGLSTHAATVGRGQNAGVPAAVMVRGGQGIYEHSVPSPGEDTDRNGVGTEVGLFEELTPIGVKASTIISENRENCPFQSAVGRRDGGTPQEESHAVARSRQSRRSRRMTTEGAAAPVQGLLEQSLPDESGSLSTESASQLIRGASSDRRGRADGRFSSDDCDVGDGSYCSGASIVGDIRVHTAGGEDQVSNAAKSTTDRHRTGPSGGTSDGTISSSTHKLSSPQVCVVETPPSSPWNRHPSSLPSSSARRSQNVVSNLFQQPPAHEVHPGVAQLLVGALETKPSPQTSRRKARASPADLVPSIATIPETQPSLRTPSRGAAVTRRSSRRSSTRKQEVETMGRVGPRISGKHDDTLSSMAAGGGRGDCEGSSAEVDLPQSPVAGTIERTQVGGSMAEVTTHIEVAPASLRPHSVDRTAKPVGDGLCVGSGASPAGRCTQGQEQAELHAAEARVGEYFASGSDGVVLAAGVGGDKALNLAVSNEKSPLNRVVSPARSSTQGRTADGSEPKMKRMDKRGRREGVFAESGGDEVVVSAGVEDCAGGEDGDAEAACLGGLAEEYVAEYESQTPSSGAGFDYSPADFSQAQGGEGCHEDGVTAAKMLSFKRDLCPELSSSAPPPSPGKTAMSLNIAPSQTRPPVTPRVPNPYTSGFGSLVSPPRHASTTARRSLPVSPFAVAAAAAAAKRSKVAARASATRKVETAPTMVVMKHAQHNTARAVPAHPGAPSSVPAPSLAPSLASSRPNIAGSGRVRPQGVAGNVRSGPSASASVGSPPPITSCASTAPRSSQSSELPLRVASPLNITTGKQRKNILRKEAGAGSEVKLPSVAANGFQTASGTPVAVTTEALAKVEHIFRDDSAVMSDGRMASAAPSSASVRVAVSASNPPTSCFLGECVVLGGGKDGYGLEEAVTTGKPSRNQDVVAIVAGGRSAACGDSMGAENAVASYMGAPRSSDAGPREFAGFQTGRGRTLSVSSEALAKVRHLFCDDNSSGPMPSASRTFKPTTAQLPRRKIGAMVSRSPAVTSTGVIPLERDRMMGTGSLKRPAVFSNPGGRREEAGFRAATPQLEAQGGRKECLKSQETLEARAMAAPTLSLETAFQTGGGKELHVCEQTMARVSHLFSDATPVASAHGDCTHPSGAARTTTATTISSITKPASVGGGSAESRPYRVLPRRGREEMSTHDDASVDSRNICDGGDGASDGEMDKAGKDSIAPTRGEDGEDQLHDASWDADDSSHLPTTGSNAFQTAGGRALSVSAEALAKVSHLFQEANAGDGTGASGSGKGTGSVERANKSPAALSGHYSSRRYGAEGNQTALGRNLRVSVKSAARVSRSLESEESGGFHGGLNDRGGTAAPDRGITGSTRGLVRPAGGGVEASAASSGVTGEIATGFKTGRGRSLNVTSEALEKTKRFFTEERPEVERGNTGRCRKDALGTHHDAFSVGDVSRATERQSGVQQASGGMPPGLSPMPGIRQPDIASSGNQVDASSLTDSFDPHVSVSISTAALGSGFRIGNGAAVFVSAEALKRAKQFLSGAGELDVRVAAQGGDAAPPPPSVRESGNDVVPTRGDVTGSGASVFSTGSGRAIEVSAEALAQAENMFREAEPCGKSASRGQHPAVNNVAVARSGDGRGGSRGGGSMSSVKMGGDGSSCEALARARKLFEDVGPSNEPRKTMPPPTACLGAGVSDGGVDSNGRVLLSTETGENLEVVAKGVGHVQGNIRGRYGGVEPAAGKASPLVGTEEDEACGKIASAFSTGAGRTINVSVEALVQAQRKYGEMESSTNQSKSAPSPTVSGGNNGENDAGLFWTGRAIEASAGALSQGQGKLGETDPSKMPETMPPPGGGESGVSAFSTGAGRAIEVSAEALALAQKRFGEAESSAEPVNSSPDPVLSGGNIASVFSTGRGRAVEVSPAALAQAAKFLGDGGAAGVARNGGGTKQATVGGRERVTPRWQGAGAQAQPQVNREHPSRDCRLPPAEGKENGEGGQPKRLLGTLARSTGVANGIAPRARHWGVFTPNHKTHHSGQKFMRGGPNTFLPPSRRRTMPPPTGMATPSSGGKALCRAINPADAASIAAPVGRGTPLSAKRRGLGYGSGGLHAMKRPRSTSKAGTPAVSPRASPHGPRSSGRGMFPRPSLPRRSSVLVTASPSSASSKISGGGDGNGGGIRVRESSCVAQGEPGCGTSRVLFDSVNAAADSAAGGAGKVRRFNHRRPLSSLLNEPSQVVQSLQPCDVEKNDVGFIEGGIVGVGDDKGEERMIPPLRPPLKGSTVAHQPSTGEERREVVALLLRVTARNAVDLRFGADGVPCCLRAATASPELTSATAGGGSLGPAAAVVAKVEGTLASSGVLTGKVTQREQECESCRGGEDHHQASESAANKFRDELVRSGKDGGLATSTWVENHFRWIVWKLAAMERRFLGHFPAGYLTAKTVSRQLRYRYEVEIDRAKKPALKAALQGDAAVSRPMVLCVSRVYTPGELGDRLGTAATLIEVTDGWYPVDASLDDALSHFLRRDNIVPGTKLAVSNATLEPGTTTTTTSSSSTSGNGGVGIDPLELLQLRDAGELPPGAGPRLRLVVNSTRRARWDANLGFFWPRTHPSRKGGAKGGGETQDAGDGDGKSALEIPLCTVVPGGGVVTATRVVVLRRYPTLFISGGAGDGGGRGAKSGQRVVLSEAEEEGERELHQARLQRRMETAASGIEEEVMADVDDATPASFRRMNETENPSAYFDGLAPDEQEDVLEWQERHQQVVEGLRQKALDERLRNMDEVERRVRQLITLRVTCTCQHGGPIPGEVTNGARNGSSSRGVYMKGGDRADPKERRKLGRRHSLPPMLAVLKVWAPNEATAALLSEGAELRLHSVAASNCHRHVTGCSLELSTGRQTKIEVISSSRPPLNESSGNSTSKAPSATSDGRFPPRLPHPRFVPRRFTPLALLKTRDGSCEGRSRLDGGNRRGKGGSTRRAADGGEVDFVGCLFAVTMECSANTDGHGEVMLATDSSALACPPDGCGGGRDTAATGGPVGTRFGPKTFDGKSDSAEEVTFRVHFTGPSGACVRVEKHVRSNLARHHRILRSTPGTCWAVMNAACSTAGVASVRGNGLPVMGEYGTHDAGILRWCSTTAVGGNRSGTPPRTLGGAPTGHLSPALLSLRLWAEGVEGKSAVRRERQRLVILLAGERQAWGKILGREATATPDGEVSLARSKPVNDKPGFCRPLPVQEQERPRTATVVGYVSSFGLRAAYPARCLGIDSHHDKARRAHAVGGTIPPSMDMPQAEGEKDFALPWLRLDTGGRLLVLQLTMETFEQLLRESVDDEKLCPPSAVSNEEAAQPKHTDGAVVTPMRTDAEGLLFLARAILECRRARDAIGSTDDKTERGGTAVANIPEVRCTTRDAAGCIGDQSECKGSTAASNPDVAVKGHASAPHVPPVSSVSVTIADTSAVGTSDVAVVGETGDGRVSSVKGDTIEKLADTVVRVAQLQCASDEPGWRSVGACVAASGETKVGDGALPSKSVPSGKARAGGAARDESKTHGKEQREEGAADSAGNVSVALPAFLAQLAKTCSGKQLAFSIRMLPAEVWGRDTGVVERVEVLDTARRAGDLLERLACCVRS